MFILFISLFDNLLYNINLLKIIYAILFLFMFFIFQTIPKRYNLLLILDFFCSYDCFDSDIIAPNKSRTKTCYIRFSSDNTIWQPLNKLYSLDLPLIVNVYLFLLALGLISSNSILYPLL
jgi:hypothetical protein